MREFYKVNRIIWGGIFISGSLLWTYLEYSHNGHIGLGWFLITSIWSAVCAIAYSLTEWLIHQKL